MAKGAKGWETEGEGPYQTRYSKLLVKDKPLYSEKEGKQTLWGERNEVAVDETKLRGDWKLQQTRTNQHAKLALETRGEQQRSINRREWLAVETPEERELRLECWSTRCREQPMLSQLPLFQQCSIQSKDVIQTWLRWTCQHALLVHFPGSLSPKA